MIYNNLIQLFNETCFNINLEGENGMIIYGQYNKKLSNGDEYWKSIFNIESAKGNIEEFSSYIKFLDHKNGKNQDKNMDFYIFVKGELKKFVGKRFNITINNIKLKSIKMYFPFLNINLNTNNSESNIIFTMVKDYNHRLDEWIKYNLKLGFDAIVLFDNSKNNNNPLNERESHKQNIYEITNKYKNVHVIDFPYKPFIRTDWGIIQRIAFQIFVNAFKYTCRYIALFDADEFIYIPNSDNNIKNFLSNYNENLRIKSNILTNQKKNDTVNNNILDLCRYDAGNKYTKSIIYCPSIYNNIHVIKHHCQENSILLNKNIIIHYHCWVNKRCTYKKIMTKIDELYLFYKK